MQFRMTVSSPDLNSMLYRLDEDTLGLALQYKIALTRCEPTTRIVVPGVPETFANGDGILHDGNQVFNLDPWEEWEWFAFTSNFSRVITDFWSEKFQLIPSRPWLRMYHNGPLTAQKVTCFVDIELASLPPGAHLHYFIIKPSVSTPGFRSFAVPIDRTGMFTDDDLGTKTRRRRTFNADLMRDIPVSYFQTTIAHEFGHSMQLEHVNGFGNDPIDYGITLDERSNVMGYGSQLNEDLASPWLSQLRQHIIRAPNDGPVEFAARLLGQQSPGHMYIERDMIVAMKRAFDPRWRFQLRK